MRKNRVICFLMLLLLMHSIIAGCTPRKVTLQTVDNQFIAHKKTNLIAGLKEFKDNRPEDEKERDQRYERSNPATINEYLYKNLKLSGIFQDVLIGKFDNKDIDVILDPSVDHFYYDERANGWTPVAFLFALTGIGGLLYLALGGPASESYAETSLGVKLATIEGSVLTIAKGEKSFNLNVTMHNHETTGIGKLEGKALSYATYDMLSMLATNIDSIKLPKSKLEISGNCGSDKDCKGERVCVSGMCTNLIK